MRDINRIEPILEKISKIWHLQPDLRFGQIIALVQSYCEELPSNLFYVEDDILDFALEKTLQQINELNEEKHDVIGSLEESLKEMKLMREGKIEKRRWNKTKPD